MALMRLSARADYALRAAIELAAASSGHVTADQLARAQQIPGKFLETILTQLRRAGLVESERRGMNVYHRPHRDAIGALCAVLDPNCCT